MDERSRRNDEYWMDELLRSTWGRSASGHEKNGSRESESQSMESYKSSVPRAPRRRASRKFSRLVASARGEMHGHGHRTRPGHGIMPRSVTAAAHSLPSPPTIPPTQLPLSNLNPAPTRHPFAAFASKFSPICHEFHPHVFPPRRRQMPKDPGCF